MPTFYHYTDDEGAENIIRSGTIQASLKFMTNGDVAYGNGVYLTALNPETSTKQQIAMNNWQNNNANTMKKLKNYFILEIPESDIRNTNATSRNIFLFGHRNDLRLHKYKWVLKDYDSASTIASYKYRISSAMILGNCMVDFVMIDETVNGRPVYKGPQVYLFMSSKGQWIVGADVGEDKGGLSQVSDYSLGPIQNVPWKYSLGNGWKTDDDTLKVIAYGGIVMTFSFDKI